MIRVIDPLTRDWIDLLVTVFTIATGVVRAFAAFLVVKTRMRSDAFPYNCQRSGIGIQMRDTWTENA